jgi:hypothetical protein
MASAIRAATGEAWGAARRFDNVQRAALGAGTATLSAMATGARRALRLVACAASILALVYLAPVGWRDGPLPTPREPSMRATHERTVTGETSVAGSDDARVEEAAAALRDASTSENERLLLVDELARDPSDAATAILSSVIDSPSLLVSMASIRALRGRPCSLVEAPLLQWTVQGSWQDRAWAAKVLGENGCTNSVPDLRLDLARERDARVRRQLATTLATLGEGIAG